MDRKEFLRFGCNSCLAGVASIFLAGVEGCSPSYNVFKTTVRDNLVEVPLQIFEKGNLQFIRPAGWQYDIAVQKNKNGTFAAMLMRCTHQDNQLTPAQNGFSCSLHGSRFGKDGNVVKGPAEKALKKFGVKTSNNNLIISI